jgi:hypothetical protein
MCALIRRHRKSGLQDPEQFMYRTWARIRYADVVFCQLKIDLMNGYVGGLKGVTGIWMELGAWGKLGSGSQHETGVEGSLYLEASLWVGFAMSS